MKIKIISITKFNSCTTLLKYMDIEYITSHVYIHEFFEGHLLINESNGNLEHKHKHKQHAQKDLWFHTNQQVPVINN